MTESLLNYRLEGSGRPLVLLHPIGLDLECWDAMLRHIGPGTAILRVDLRGHGRSSPTDADPSLLDYARDVHELLWSLGAAPAAVLGLSFGGMIAQTLTLNFPADVSSLVLAGCPCTFPESARIAVRARGTDARDGMDNVIKTTLERWFTAEFIAAGGAEKTRERLLKDNPGEWARAWAAISQIDTADRLHEIGVPTLCVAGEIDAAAPPAILEGIAKRVPGARLQVLPGAPHMMQIEGAERFGAAVKSFLDAQSSGRVDNNRIQRQS